MTKPELTDRQAAFVREYGVDKNGTQAAIRAGYSKRTANEQAARLLAKVSVRAAVDALLAKSAEVTETNTAWVRNRLKEEATDMNDGSSASRVRAVELIGKMNGDFEADNKQKAGLFDKLPVAEAKRIQERLLDIERRSSVAGAGISGSASRTAH